MTQSNKNGNKAINTILMVMLQVGAATLVIVLLSVFGGLWLDRQFDTSPLFTAILIIAGIPITIVIMYRIARRTIARLAESEKENTPPKS